MKSKIKLYLRSHMLSSLLFFVAGFFLLTSGVFYAHFRWQQKNYTGITTGVILANEYERERPTTPSTRQAYSAYFPVVTFTLNGIEYEARSGFGQIPAAYKEGEIVEVAYNLSNPQEYLIDPYSFRGKLAIPVLFGVGILVVLLGVLGLRFEAALRRQFGDNLFR